MSTDLEWIQYSNINVCIFFFLGQIFTSLSKLRVGHHTTFKKEIKT